MKNLDLISNMEAHLLVCKAVDSTIQSLKESPLKSIREAADYWAKQISQTGVEEEDLETKGCTTNENEQNA